MNNVRNNPCPNCGAQLNQADRKILPDGKYTCPVCHKTYIQKENWFRYTVYLLVLLKLLDIISWNLAEAIPSAQNKEITSFIIEAALAIIIGFMHAKNIGILRKLGLTKLVETEQKQETGNGHNY